MLEFDNMQSTSVLVEGLSAQTEYTWYINAVNDLSTTQETGEQESLTITTGILQYMLLFPEKLDISDVVSAFKPFKAKLMESAWGQHLELLQW